MYNLTDVQKERITVWVVALRSGKYQQCEGCLRDLDPDNFGFCCLGVACDVSGLSEWNITNRKEGNYLGSDRALTHETLEYYGLTSTPFVSTKEDGEKTIKKSLSSMNDSGTSFTKIADLIESTYLGE